jgi:hypothetical protein
MLENLPHKAPIFAASRHGLGFLSLCALEDRPVIECVASTSLDHNISMIEWVNFFASPHVSNIFFWAFRIEIPGCIVT